jgi:hypothetical protein
LAAKPVLANDAFGEVPTDAKVPPLAPVARKMSYPVTAILSEEGDQDRLTDDAVMADAIGVPGTVGDCVSPVLPEVVATTGEVKLDVLPAASRART